MIKFIREFSDRLKLNARFNLFIAALLAVIFSSLGFYLFYTQKQEIFRNSDKQLRVLLDDLVNIFQVQTDMKLAKLGASINLAQYMLNDRGGIIQVDSLPASNLAYRNFMGALKQDTLRVWTLHGLDLVLDQEKTFNGDRASFVHQVKKLTGVENISILRRVPGGFVRVSSTMTDEYGNSLINEDATFVPESSPVVKSVTARGKYSGRANVNGSWHLAYYYPIKVNGKIEGLLEVSEPQMDYEVLKPIFTKKTYLQSGYPYIVSGDGFSVINKNTEIEGSDLRATKFFKLLVQTKNSNKEAFRYFWPEDETGEWKWTYFKFFEPLDSYIATSIFEEELFTGLDKIRNGIIIGVFISIILFFIGTSFIIRPITSSIQQLVSIISIMAKGKSVQRIDYHKRDEIGDIISSLNTLIQGLSETARFSNEIEKGNYDSDFMPLSKDDTLGNALLDMRDSLQNAQREEAKRRMEDEKRKWTTEGLAMFGDILRKNTENLDRLSDSIIKNLVRYLGANQGGLFIVDDEPGSQVHLKLISAFAYDRKRHYDREIFFGEGLVSSCAIEQQTIHVGNLPDEYLEIQSGLGQAAPKSLLIVPLKLNEEVFGVVEMASFKPFLDYQIDFVEKLGENIASTLAATKINERTSKLLSESRKKSEEMKTKEEQMRVSLDQLQAAQEDSAKRQAEMSGVVSALDTAFLVVELDMEGRVLKANDPMLALMGTSLDDIRGKYYRELLQLDARARAEFEKAWREIKAGNSKSRVQKVVLRDLDFWFSETYTPIFDNKGVPYKVLNITVDTTDTKMQELEIQELLKDSRKTTKKLAAQEKLNAYNVEKLEKMQADSIRRESEITSMLNAIDSTSLRAEFSIDGRIVHANSNFLKKMELTADEAKGLSHKTFLPKEEHEHFEAAWENIRLGNTYHNLERLKTRTGKDIWLLLTYSPVMDRQDKITQILLLGNDLTKQKLNENRTKNHAIKMLEKNKKMRQTVKELESFRNQLWATSAELESFWRIFNVQLDMATFDLEGRLVEATDESLRKIGRAKEQKARLNLLDWENPDSPEQLAEYERLWKEIEKGRTINQVKSSRLGNQTLWSTVTYVPVINENKEVVKLIRLAQEMAQPVHQGGARVS